MMIEFKKEGIHAVSQ
ncbi:hypothetical protein [Candidatus Kuenenia stuttgartiensis]